MNKLKRGQRLSQIASSYRRQEEKLNYLPIRLWIELSSACNLRCVMCPQSSPDSIKGGLMDFELFKKIIDEAKKFVYDINLHHRGESLLHPELARMVDYAKKAGLYTRLHTNATLLDGEKGRGIIDAGLDFISFSFDGFTPETYEKIRPPANFKATIDNISNFLRLKEDLGKVSPFTIFETMELDEVKTGNYQTEKQELKDKLYGLHLNRFVVKSPHNWGGSYASKENEKTAKSVKFSACTFPWFAMVILWNGEVSPCPQDFFGRLIMGSVNNNSLAYIWVDKPYISLRRAMRERKVATLEPCRGCDMLKRPTFLGIPRPNLKIFFKEIFFGHR